MERPFEDPLKTELTQRLATALDLAGFEMVAREAIPLPEDSGLRGKLLGDIHCLDSEGIRYVYFVRPRGDRAVPEWIANFARLGRTMEDVRIYVVTAVASEALVKTCRACGSGLLTLSEENALSILLDPNEPSQERSAAFQRRVKQLRARLVDRQTMSQQIVMSDFNIAKSQLIGTSGKLDSVYLDPLQQQFAIWTDWAEDLSTRLDSVEAGDEKTLDEIEAQIEQGPAVS